ncbi:MAG TPA: AAA family ATPase [Vicinamibacteria bacterium]
MASRIKRVRIEGFRSIQTVEFNPSPLCALVGENSAGKSNILQALKVALGKDWHRVDDFSEDDILDRRPDGEILIEIEFDPPPEHVAFKNTDGMPVPLLRFHLTRYKRNTARARKGDLRLDAKPLKANGDQVFVLASPPRRGQKPEFTPLTSIPNSLKRQVPLIYVGTDRQLRGQLPSTRYSLLRRLLEDVDEVVRTTTVDETDDTVAERFIQKLEEALQILKVREFVELEGLVAKHALENLGMDPETDRDRFGLSFGLQDSMEFFKAIRILVDEGDLQLDSSQLGDGAQNAIVLAIFQAYERLRKKGAVFLIEEPEMHLHPHRARFFYQTLRRISRENQVIYTTHSPYLVAIPEFEEVRLVKRDVDNRTSIVESDLPPSEELREKLRKEFDPERNELFFAKHVILVEGDTEKLALPEYATRLGLDLDRLGVSIIEVGGKRSLLPFARIIMSFEIPLTILFDTDSSDFGTQKEEEQVYNDELHGLAGDGVWVVEFAPKYEHELRTALGDELYARKAEEYGGTSKAIRARRIAADPETPIPSKIEELLRGLDPQAQGDGGKPEAEQLQVPPQEGSE